MSQIIRTCQRRVHFGRPGAVRKSLCTLWAQKQQAPHVYVKHCGILTYGIDLQADDVPQSDHLKHFKNAATADNTTKRVFFSCVFKDPDTIAWQLTMASALPIAIADCSSYFLIIIIVGQTSARGRAALLPSSPQQHAFKASNPLTKSQPFI